VQPDPVEEEAQQDSRCDQVHAEDLRNTQGRGGGHGDVEEPGSGGQHGGRAKLLFRRSLMSRRRSKAAGVVQAEDPEDGMPDRQQADEQKEIATLSSAP